MKTNLQITETLAAFASETELSWLAEQKALTGKALALAFVKTPRYITKKTIEGDRFTNWTLDQLARLDLLMQLDEANIDSLFVKTVRIIAQARTNEIAYQMGTRAQSDILGKFVRIVGESMCFIIGTIAKPFLAKKFNNWLTLYSTK